MNVLYLIDSLTHGGTERQLVELIKHLDHARIHPHLCTLKPSKGLYDSLPIPKVCLNFRSFVHPSLVPVTLKLASFIRQHRIDIVQTFFQDACLLGALIKALTRVKLVGSFRDLGFWATSSENFKMRIAYPSYNGFIANSEAVKQHFSSTYNIATDKIKVIYNGLDTAFIPQELSEAGDDTPPIVGIVANLNRPVKRVQDFIEIAARIHRNRPETRFYVIGGGHLQADLERQAADLGLTAATTFTGMVENPLDFIIRFSVGVITSETEGFCNALIEYMACGLPVVATQVGGTPELVRNGENGFLYETGNIDQAVAFIQQLLDDTKLYGQISDKNRNAIQQRFSMKSSVNLTSTYYEHLIAKAPE
ncbi:glycosyltransferase [Desulfobulbus rhabdoformis]|uniref:glycosyltransferase n=1 Tax=Desulfobulbus rhabdoformis TaxID=34032 RepID=UPI001963D3E9|nr:glycosyltransferase [Desulfobulbus rhabdoformis]MBM9616718.1 glycosyltransferase [Desulfobulbus rhabdoformis]